MGAKGSVEAAKLNADGWGHLEVCNTKKHLNLILTYFILGGNDLIIYIFTTNLFIFLKM